jgi:hypothetical protein
MESTVLRLVETDSEGWIWVKVRKENFCVSFTFLPKDSIYYNNVDNDMFDSLAAGIRRYDSLGHIVIMGDLNARTGEQLDYQTDGKVFEKYINCMHGVNDDANECPLRERVSLDSVQ